MLRLVVVVLLLLNAAYYVWAEGYLRAWGFAAVQQSEPQRLAQQIKPESIRIATLEEARRAEQAAKVPVRPPECLQSGMFDASATGAVRTRLEASLPADSWQLLDVREPARWIVYMGKYTNEDALQKKRAEMAGFNLKLEALTNPTLQPGFSLGGFETQAAANNELANLVKRGVRTARVVQERAEVRGQVLRVPAADEALRSKLDEIKAELAVSGLTGLRTCPR